MFWGWRNGLALKEHALLWKRTQVWFLAPISHACQPPMTLLPRELTLLHTASVAFLCSIQCRAYCGETLPLPCAAREWAMICKCPTEQTTRAC